MKIIDSHVHFFNLAQGQYHWLKADNPPFWSDKHLIAKSVNETDLVLNKSSLLAGFVHIEAGYNNEKPWTEIAWLEQSCQLPFRSIASIDLTLSNEKFQQQISQLITYPSVVGCRHILDDQAFELLSSTQVQQNFSILNQYQLNFEVQMPFSNQQAVEALSNIIEKNPDITFIINHAGMSPTAINDYSTQSDWYLGLSNVSSFKNVAIKCSGWEMFDRQYFKNQWIDNQFIDKKSFNNNQWSQEIIHQCITLFGDNSVMISSNFPLTILCCSYQAYWEMITQALTNNQQKLLHDNSQYWYKFT